MSILIQSIHTRKIKRFAFACPRETFSNRVFFSIYYFFFFYHKITNHISKRNSLERKKKSWENFYLFFSAKTFAGLNGTVTGWGATAESGAISQTLQEVTVPILSNADCRASKYPSQRITDNMLCAGYKEGSKDSCQVINNKFFFSVIVTINTSPLLTTYTNGNCYVFVHLHLLCVYHLIYTSRFFFFFIIQRKVLFKFVKFLLLFFLFVRETVVVPCMSSTWIRIK